MLKITKSGKLSYVILESKINGANCKQTISLNEDMTEEEFISLLEEDLRTNTGVYHFPIVIKAYRGPFFNEAIKEALSKISYRIGGFNVAESVKTTLVSLESSRKSVATKLIATLIANEYIDIEAIGNLYELNNATYIFNSYLDFFTKNNVIKKCTTNGYTLAISDTRRERYKNNIYLMAKLLGLTTQSIDYLLAN